MSVSSPALACSDVLVLSSLLGNRSSSSEFTAVLALSSYSSYALSLSPLGKSSPSVLCCVWPWLLGNRCVVLCRGSVLYAAMEGAHHLIMCCLCVILLLFSNPFLISFSIQGVMCWTALDMLCSSLSFIIFLFDPCLSRSWGGSGGGVGAACPFPSCQAGKRWGKDEAREGCWVSS